MIPYYEHGGITIYHGDCRDVLATLPDESLHCCVTSPPYWGLRDYGCDGQLGLEATPEEYVEKLIGVFREVRRVLHEDGTLWLNLGDTYNGYMANQRATSISERNQHARPKFDSGHGPRTRGLKSKDMVGIPWRVAFALQADGWYLRSDIIWSKPNPMPESVTDRPTKAHEYVFLLSKSQRYYFDSDAVKEQSVSDHPSGNGYARPEQRSRGGRGSATHWAPTKERNIRSVWSITAAPFPGAHFAVMPPKLIMPCIKAGCPKGGVVLDPFAGAGTVPYVARELGYGAVAVELNTDYCEIAAKRLAQEVLPFGDTQ